MEETMNLTAERSLEIITEQIERSRKSVAEDVGMTLLISGLCIVGVAIIVIIGTLLTNNWLFYLLYMLIPVFIWAIERYVKRNKPKVPASVISTMVDKTWQTFGIFVAAFFVLSIFYNNLMSGMSKHNSLTKAQEQLRETEMENVSRTRLHKLSYGSPLKITFAKTYRYSPGHQCLLKIRDYSDLTAFLNTRLSATGWNSMPVTLGEIISALHWV